MRQQRRLRGSVPIEPTKEKQLRTVANQCQVAGCSAPGAGSPRGRRPASIDLGRKGSDAFLASHSFANSVLSIEEHSTQGSEIGRIPGCHKAVQPSSTEFMRMGTACSQINRTKNKVCARTCFHVSVGCKFKMLGERYWADELNHEDFSLPVSLFPAGRMWRGMCHARRGVSLAQDNQRLRHAQMFPHGLVVFQPTSAGWCPLQLEDTRREPASR